MAIKEAPGDVVMVNKAIARHNFGWVLDSIRFEYDGLKVEPANNFQEVNEYNLASLRTEQWIFIPNTEISEPFSAFFTLKGNHEMIVDESAIDVPMADRLIAVLGFLIGVPLCPAGMGHIYKIPYRRGKLSMFKASDEELGRCLSIAARFYKSAAHEVAGLMDAAIHWHLAAQCQNYPFERFAWQYSVLDNIYRLLIKMEPTFKKANKHELRPINLKNHLNLALPLEFSDPTIPNENAQALVKVRNELVHEARWLGQPLGPTMDESSRVLTRALCQFNAKIILKCLGICCDFYDAAHSQETVPLALHREPASGG